MILLCVKRSDRVKLTKEIIRWQAELCNRLDSHAQQFAYLRSAGAPKNVKNAVIEIFKDQRGFYKSHQ